MSAETPSAATFSAVRSTMSPLMITQGSERYTRMFPMVRLPSIVILPARNIANPTPTSMNMTTICKASVAGIDIAVVLPGADGVARELCPAQP